MATGFSPRHGLGTHADLDALTARLADFDRRVSDVRVRTDRVDAKTAAYILMQAEGSQPMQEGADLRPRKARLVVSRA